MSGKKIRLSQVRELAKLQCTEAEACAVLGIGASQFSKLKKTNDKFREAWEGGKEVGKVALRRKQMNLATGNASMAIHLGKTMLGQSDKSQLEVTGKDGGPVEFDFTKLSKAERDKFRSTLAQATNGS